MLWSTLPVLTWGRSTLLGNKRHGSSPQYSFGRGQFIGGGSGQLLICIGRTSMFHTFLS